MAKYKPIKVKRSNTRLYKKKKSPLRKFIEIALFVLVICGIVFLGYCVAGPIIDYFGKESSTTASPWVPPEIVDETTTESETSNTDQTAPAETTMNAYIIDSSALSNRSALAAALSSAKSAGYSQVVLELKDEEGFFCYKSEIDGIKDSEAISGSLTLSEIVSQVEAQELELIAEINTLKDSVSPKFVDGIAYRFADDSYTWLDASEEDGGKRWINPFNSASIQFFSEILKELSESGIDSIILKNTVFPAFRPYDESILEARFFTANRYTALVSFVSSLRGVGTTTGSEVYVESQLSDILQGYAIFENTAELFNEKQSLNGFTSLTGLTVVAVCTKDDFTETLTLSPDGAVTVDLPTDKGDAVVSLFEYAADYLGDKLTLIPCIDSDGLTSAELAEIRSSLAAAGYKDIIVK